MNSPRQSEMDKLRAIQSQLQAVTDRIATRLPTQRGHLAALVCARKWQLAMLSKLRPETLTQETMDAIVKKSRMEIGAFEYSTKEQSELLTRALFKLDDILSHGDAEIKDTRKALVLSIQAQLERADALKTSAAKLKEFTERVIASFPTAAVEETEMKEENEHAVTEPEAEAETATDDKMEAAEEVNTNEVRALFDEYEVGQDETHQTEDSSVKQRSDEPMEDANDGEEEKVEDEDEEEEDEEDEGLDIRSLPVWRPYYQIQQRGDGVYILANLHGVKPRHIRVEAIPHNGVIRISGFKLPTQKDLILSRFSGQPTFGRFEIAERFPANQLSLDHATQQLAEDGTLQVRLPFYAVQRPRFVRRVSPFQPHRLMVW